MKYFLDTNVIIDMLKGKHPCMFKHFEKTYSTDTRVPAIVVAELEYGAAHSTDYEKNKSLYERFADDLQKEVDARYAFYEAMSKDTEGLISL